MVHGILLDNPSAVVVLVIGPGGDAGPPAASWSSASRRAWRRTPWTPATRSGRRAPRRAAGGGATTNAGAAGIVPRSSASPLAAAAHAEGRVVRADRVELERLVRHRSTRPVLRRREALLDAAVDAEADETFAEIAAEADAATAGSATAMPERGRAERGGHEPRAEVVEGVAALDAALDAAEAVSDTRAGGETAGRVDVGSVPAPRRRTVGDDRLGDDGSVTTARRRPARRRLARRRAGGRAHPGAPDPRGARRGRRRVHRVPPGRRRGAVGGAGPRHPGSGGGRARRAARADGPCCTATGRWPTSLCSGPRPRGPVTASR